MSISQRVVEPESIPITQQVLLSLLLESIDLAAFLVVAGHEIEIYRNPEGRRAVFSFREDASLHSDIIAYERGASLPAKRLLNTRSYLFREASRVVKEGKK